MGLDGQFARARKAVLTRWKGVTEASLARPQPPGKPPTNNYFARRDLKLDPEVAIWLEQETGFRAAWLMFGELPERVQAGLGASLEASFVAGHRMALEGAIASLRHQLANPTPGVDTTAPLEGPSVPEAKVFRAELTGQGIVPPAAGKPPRRRKQG
jgi:hypothetical protein